MKLAIRILITALLFTFVFPMIPGAHFTGGFWPDGIVYGLLMAVVAFAVSLAILAFTVGTAGLGAVLIILGFWIIPAIQLQLLAHFFPKSLAFDGWGSAIICGLILMVVNILTAASRSSAKK
jgi:uncharacterized membrane protein YvlD (DUF360 family)